VRAFFRLKCRIRLSNYWSGMYIWLYLCVSVCLSVEQCSRSAHDCDRYRSFF